MREFKDKISKITIQCSDCGLVEGLCICEDKIDISSDIEFWLLTHENELSRTTNTGRLIENAISTTKVFKWNRTNPPKELLNLITSDEYNIYIIMAADRESEKARVVEYYRNEKKTAFLILDGTWKEARKMLRKSDFLSRLPILSLDINEKTSYNLRRNSDLNHICTVEVGVELLKIAGEPENAKKLNGYFNVFMDKYVKGRNYQGDSENGKKNI